MKLGTDDDDDDDDDDIFYGRRAVTSTISCLSREGQRPPGVKPWASNLAVKIYIQVDSKVGDSRT